jgi:hypothetical protein
MDRRHVNTNTTKALFIYIYIRGLFFDKIETTLLLGFKIVVVPVFPIAFACSHAPSSFNCLEFSGGGRFRGKLGSLLQPRTIIGLIPFRGTHVQIAGLAKIC